MPAWPDASIAELAARQRTLVTHAQLRALGVSTSAIDRAHHRGRLHRVHFAVYSLVASSARPAWAPEQAAILAVGARAVLSHATAARLHGVQVPGLPDRRVHVTVVARQPRSRSGLIIHRTVDLPRAEHHRLDGLPVTSVARTVVDLAAQLTPPELAALVDRALKRCSRAKRVAATRRRPQRPCVSLLLALLDPARPSADVWSHAERLLLDRVRAADLQTPEANVAVGPYVVDLLWRDARVIVEFDSAEHHSGPAAVRWDTARHNHLTTILGYDVIHVTWEELTEHPERLLVQIGVAVNRPRR